MLLAVTLTACATMQKRWEEARAVDTIDGYRTFLANYGDSGDFASLAAARLDDLRWGDAQREDTSVAYARYLSREPEGDHRDRAQRRIEELDYQTAITEGTMAALESYLTRHRSSERAWLVQEELDKLRFEGAAADDTSDAYGEYLAQFPDGRHADSARESREARAWERAVERGSLDAYIRFLDTFPSGELAEEARARIAAIRFRTVRLVVNLRETWRDEPGAASSRRGLRLLADYTLAQRLRAVGYRVELIESDVRGVDDEDVHPHELRPPEAGVGLMVLDYWERAGTQSWSDARSTKIEARLRWYSPAMARPIFEEVLRTATNTSDANASEAAMHANAQELLGYGLVRANLPMERYLSR